MWNIFPWQLCFSDMLIDWPQWMKSWGFNLTELLSLWDWTSHENIVLHTDQWVIYLFKIPYLNKINKNWKLVAAWNHWLFCDTFNDQRPGKVAVYKSHFHVLLWKKNLQFECESRISQQGQYSKSHRKRSRYHKQCTILKENRPKWLRGF